MTDGIGKASRGQSPGFGCQARKWSSFPACGHDPGVLVTFLLL